MVTITVSVTAPVNNNDNESSTNPPIRLTHDDLWAALLAKARQPEEFVPQIEKSTVVREHEDGRGLTRRVLFKGREGEEELEEVVRFVGKMRVDFHISATGQSVSNIISHAAAATSGSDLFLTFTFVFPHPEVRDENGEEAKRLEEKYLALGREVVPRCIDVARRMKVEGRLGLS